MSKQSVWVCVDATNRPSLWPDGTNEQRKEGLVPCRRWLSKQCLVLSVAYNQQRLLLVSILTALLRFELNRLHRHLGHINRPLLDALGYVSLGNVHDAVKDLLFDARNGHIDVLHVCGTGTPASAAPRVRQVGVWLRDLSAQPAGHRPSRPIQHGEQQDAAAVLSAPTRSVVDVGTTPP